MSPWVIRTMFTTASLSATVMECFSTVRDSSWIYSFHMIKICALKKNHFCKSSCSCGSGLFRVRYTLYVLSCSSVWIDRIYIYIVHVIIIIKSEVPTFPIVIIFFRGCVPEMFITSYSVTAYTFRENREFVFIGIVQFMMSANSQDTFWLEDRIRLFVHYTISLSSFCRLIWRHWTYKMPVRYSLSSVWVRQGIFSQLPFTKYVGLCVFSLPISPVMIERLYIRCLIIIITSELWTITHCLGLGHETWVCAVCLSVFVCISQC